MTKTVDKTAGSWQRILSQTRAYSRGPGGDYDLRAYLRGVAYLAHNEAPEPIRRARAFGAVTDGIPLHAYAHEVVAGSRAGFCATALPKGVSEADYRSAVEEDRRRGERSFVVGWDHAVADYPTLLKEGVGGVLKRIEVSLVGTDDESGRVMLRSMRIAMEALSRFILRHAAQARDTGCAGMLRHVASRPPRGLHEALQLVWLTNIAFASQGRHAMALGRMDQYLLPFYEADLERGALTREAALSLICHLWARIEELGEVTNICVGGLRPDGADAVNELSYLLVEATRLVCSPHTNLSARLHDDTPERFHRACFECIRSGVGFPAIFNDHVLLAGLAEIGIPDEVARDYCMVGCIETMLSGRQQAWSDSRFNTPQFMLRALRRLAVQRDASWPRLQELLSAEIAEGLRDHTAGVNATVARHPPDRYPDPFLSALTRDCIGRARDVNDGGAEYDRFHGIAIMGLATVVDSLAAVKLHVFDGGGVPLERLARALDTDFACDDRLRLLLERGSPKYGNDEPYVDRIAAWIVDLTSRQCLKHHVEGGGRFVALMAANVQNISAGRQTGATPDGRRASEPLSDAASPHFGRDEKGPTAFLNSVAAPDYHRVLGGTVVNMKFEPEYFSTDRGAETFLAFTRVFVARRVHQLQFNFTGTETLLAARADPERHRNIVVRVSGFSAYFVELPPEVQHDVIRRRAHGLR